jgi:hypothetical protein
MRSAFHDLIAVMGSLPFEAVQRTICIKVSQRWARATLGDNSPGMATNFGDNRVLE